MPYLEELTLRLAMGVGRLSESIRSLHADYIKAAQNGDGGFSGREGDSDLYYTGFGLRGLALVGELHGRIAEKASGYLRSQLSRQAPIVDFLSVIYGGALLQTSAGIDIFSDAAPQWREAVAATLERFRRPDGGYAKTDQGQSSSTYHTFLAVLCYQLIEQPLQEPERIVALVRSRRREDGGYVEIGPMRRSGTNPTAAAAGLLKILDAADEETRRGIVDFLIGMQSDDGGLCANTRIAMADLLSTFTGTLTLADLGGLDQMDIPAARRFVRAMQLPGGGFHGGIWDDDTDVEYTFYGLGALALLSEGP